MTRIIDLPNPFESATEAGRPAAAAFVPQPGAAAVGASSPEVMATSAPGMAHLESQAKATEGKAGNAEGTTPLVRQTTTGTGLRVGAADAVQPATSEFMDVTAGETAPNSGMHRAGRTTASPNNAMAAENARETIPARPEGASVRHVGSGESPETNSDVIDIPAFLQRNPDNTFRFPSA